MKRGTQFRMVLGLLGVIFLFQEVGGQDVRYTHPLYDISFTASSHWDEILQEVNGEVFSITHPNKNMIISLSYIPGCINPEGHIREMAGRKGLIFTEGYYETLLNEHEAVVFNGQCLKGKRPYRSMMIGFPVDSGLYLMEISCPEDCFLIHQQRVKSILGTIEVGKGLVI